MQRRASRSSEHQKLGGLGQQTPSLALRADSSLRSCRMREKLLARETGWVHLFSSASLLSIQNILNFYFLLGGDCIKVTWCGYYFSVFTMYGPCNL